ncbi:MAG TPA: serine/threonine-protein kinase, partial [Myxococcales bacterium]
MVARLDERYRRGEKIGSGGMSQVFKAWDTRLKRDVAIKILHDHLAEKEESRRRFSREAEAVAKLHHPNILEIFDFSTEDGRESFIVTEYIKGRTLRDFGEEHRFHPPEIAAMAIHELACALEHAHQKGVIHRDLKPENVMIREDGVLKLMDFGIAKVLDEGDRMTMTGALVGSPAHMAPEIIEGQVATAAADIFSLGTILYWLCCHKLPFIGNNPTQTLKLILDASYPDPRQANGAVSDELAAIIAKCLAREPSGRYATAQQLREALAQELARLGLDDPAKECAQFFKQPAAYAENLKVHLIARLLAEAEGTSQGPQRNYARTIKLADRVLALETNNARAL